MKQFTIGPIEMVASLLRNWDLIVTLSKREVLGRYQGSVLGILWSFFNPVFLLVVYTFVFSVIFKARWGVENESKAMFALVLFAGLMMFNLFAECVNRAPGLILANPNYVKKIVFPLEILPWVIMGSALFHLVVSLVVWLVVYLIFIELPSHMILWLPLIILPLALLTLGFTWLLASLGVYLRDVGQVVVIAVTTLLFTSPIFWPISALPEELRSYLSLNPLAVIIEQTRNLMIFDKAINWSSWLYLMLGSMTIAWLGFAWFQKTRKGFADVV
jgi:lipopolysaccharide transport system permease protein